MWTIYKHEIVNDKGIVKRYIGITSRDVKARWRNNGYGYKSDESVFWKAIQKYGWDNFKHHILFTDLTFDEASLKEKELIAKFKTNCKRYGDDYGYNMTLGGDGVKGFCHTEETKKSLSIKSINYFKENPRTEQMNKNIGLKIKEYYNLHPEKREEVRQKIINSGRADGMFDGSYNALAIAKTSKSVAEYDMNGELIKIYPSASEAARQVGVGFQTVSRWCLKQRKPKNKHIWEYI